MCIIRSFFTRLSIEIMTCFNFEDSIYPWIRLFFSDTLYNEVC